MQSRFLRLIFSTVCLGTLLLPAQIWAQEIPAPDEPVLASASKEAEQALGSFKVPAGIKVELFAAEPLLGNPVCFTIDPQGRIFICETFRQGKGVEDNRGHGHWLDDDLAAQTVSDRLAYIHKHLKEKALDYMRQDDRIRLIEDTDGDGKADKATVYADRFNGIVEGTGAGILFHRGDVFYTNIPNLWKLRDANGDGKADQRQSLHTGYGVKFAFRGHDMHGLTMGPDGKIYYSIGDRGLNVITTDGRHLQNVNSGSVLRCNLDGSDLELFATGLRNPQELAFDDFGNLFTGDNNSDSGDQARWVYVVEGGDTGWRMEYQYLADRGPFNREKIWHPKAEGQPAYIVPPIANLASGPSGLAYYPGTGLPEYFKDRFFLVDFRGGPANSGVRTFRVKPLGAGFEVADAEETFWSILATDVEFGPDGAMYVTDWVNGWNGEGKGRIYRYSSPEVSASPIVQEVKKLLGEGFAQRSAPELVKLLAHADRRVRQASQFALVDLKATESLAEVATANASQLARIHAIWGLGQLAGQAEAKAKLDLLVKLCADSDAEIRAQAAKVLGEARHAGAFESLLTLLKDQSLRVRYFAAQGLGKLKRTEAVEPLLAMLAQNDDQDVVLRHAGVMGLWGSAGSAENLKNYVRQPSIAARMGVLLALRRFGSPEIAPFLADTDPRLVVEAARAIHDLPISAALPQLAALVRRNSPDDALMRRVLNSNFRLGTPETAASLATYAATADAPEAMRLEALAMLANWENPSPKDRVLNFWRPLDKRPADVAANALRPALAGIFSGNAKVRTEAAKVAAGLGIKEVGPALLGMLADKTQPARVRGDALLGLVSLKDGGLDTAIATSLTDEMPAVRAAARNALAKVRPADAIAKLDEGLFAAERVERQMAVATLAELSSPAAKAVLLKGADQLLSGTTPSDTRLDIAEAIRQSKDNDLQKKLTDYEAAQKSDDPVAKYQDCLDGGDAEKGRKIFLERAQVSCVRCHKLAAANEGHPVGGDVGPELSKIAVDKKRDYLLEAIVVPNKVIAKGYETVVILDTDGILHTGIVKLENDERVDLMTAEGKLVSVRKDEIEQRKPGKTSMPEDLTKHLTKFEVRDLVEFLSTLR